MRRNEVKRLLDALWQAAKSGDREAALFLYMFEPWAVGIFTGLDSFRFPQRIDH